MATLTLQDVEDKFREVFKVEPHKEKEDNPVDGSCLVGQGGKVEVVRADLESTNK